jgi:haloalkane dehalogenase
MYIHGEADRAIPTEFGVVRFKDLWPNGPVVKLPGVGHYYQEDAPLTIVALITQFMQMAR